MLDISAGDQLRLVVALASLAHRPPYQSLSNLRTKFPLSEQSSRSHKRDWRTHALALEEQVMVLKSKLQEERIESSLLRANQHLSSVACTAAEILEEKDCRPKKKKRTEQATEGTLPPDWQKLVQDLAPATRPQSMTGQLEIFSSLATLHRHSLSDAGSYTEAQMRGDVLTLTKSCLKSLGKMLKHTLELPTGSIQATHLCEAVASVLSIILSQSLYLIPGSVDDIDSLEVFLRTFHEEIFRPAIKGFVLLCEHRAPRQSDAAKKSAIDRPLPKSDIRPILLAICQSGIETMKLKPGVYESLCLLVAYTTTIHIQQEIHHRPPAAAARKREAQPAIEKHRTCQSTSRDGLWYLMALLNTSICILHPHSSPIEVATRDGIVDMLLQLLEPGDDHRQLTLIEENMVLGIAEKAWAAGWFPTCTPKEEVEPIINAVFPSSSTISDE